MLLVTHSLQVFPISMTFEIVDIVLLRVGSGVVAVKVLVDVEDKVSDGAIGVCDCQERWAGSIGNEGLGRGPVVPRKKDNLRCSARIVQIRFFSLTSCIVLTQHCG